jgi:hypothetical protein
MVNILIWWEVFVQMNKVINLWSFLLDTTNQKIKFRRVKVLLAKSIAIYKWVFKKMYSLRKAKNRKKVNLRYNLQIILPMTLLKI